MVSSIFQLDFLNKNKYFTPSKFFYRSVMKGISNRQKKVVAPKRDRDNDPVKFQRDKNRIPKKPGKKGA